MKANSINNKQSLDVSKGINIQDVPETEQDLSVQDVANMIFSNAKAEAQRDPWGVFSAYECLPLF